MIRFWLTATVGVLAYVVLFVSSAPAATPEQMAADLEQAFILEREGRDLEAIPILESIAATNPDFYAEYPGKQWPVLHIAYVLGCAYKDVGRWADAILWLEHYLPWQMARWPKADSLVPGIIASCRRHLASEGEILQPAVFLNGGTVLSAEPKPVALEGVTFVSLRGFCDSLGMEVSWDGEAMAATAYDPEKLASLACFTVGDQTASINGQEIDLRQAPYILDGRIMVPLRELVEGLGGTVKWLPEPQIVEVTYHPQAETPAAEAS